MTLQKQFTFWLIALVILWPVSVPCFWGILLALCCWYGGCLFVGPDC